MKKYKIILMCCMLYTILVTQSNNWPTYQHDFSHSGFSSSHMPHPLKEKWSYKGNSGAYFVISEDRVYARGHSEIFCLENGSVLWTVDPGLAWGFPTVEESRLYVPVQEGFLSLDTDTGTAIWKYTVPSTLPYSSPLIVDDHVIAGCSGHVWAPDAIDNTHRVVSLQKETGELLWEMHTEGSVDSSPAYHDRIYINDETAIYCISKNGELLWKKELVWVTFSSISLDEKRIFVGGDRGVMCIGMNRGESYWQFDCGEIIFNTPAVGYNKIFFGSPSGIFYCLNAETGKMIWKIETKSVISSEAVITDKKVAFAADDGMLYIVNVNSGKILESVQLTESGISCLALSNNKLFVGQDNGIITCFGSAPFSCTSFGSFSFSHIWILVPLVMLSVIFMIWGIRKI